MLFLSLPTPSLMLAFAPDLRGTCSTSSSSPLYLQLGQCPGGDVNWVIPNTPDAEMMFECMSVHIAAYRANIWVDGGFADSFTKKLLERGLNAGMVHEIAKCTWDKEERIIKLPTAKLENDTFAEFEQQDWVNELMGITKNNASKKKKYINPQAVFH